MNNHLCFNGNRILYCTTGNNTKSNSNLTIKENFDGSDFDINEYFDNTEKLRNDCKKGNIINNCEGCHYLLEKDWDENTFERKIKYILISNYRACNSKCIYCISRSDYNPKNIKNDTYNILPVIADMINKKAITKDTKIDFAGGECTLYPYFEELLQLLIQADVKDIIIHTNAIIYSKAIELGIKKGIVSICVSTDSGTRKIHEKVKGVKTYNTVWNNIKKYRKAEGKTLDNKVCVKYILVENINDNEKEIEEWIKKAVRNNINILRFNADNDIFIKYQKNDNNNHPYLAKIIVLSEFFVKTAQKYNVKYILDYNIDAAYKMLNINMPHF